MIKSQDSMLTTAPNSINNNNESILYSQQIEWRKRAKIELKVCNY